jgi:hypothetical protein
VALPAGANRDDIVWSDVVALGPLSNADLQALLN